jgi:hypothetical protein
LGRDVINRVLAAHRSSVDVLVILCHLLFTLPFLGGF